MSETLYSDRVVALEARDTTLYLKGAPGFENAAGLASAGIEWLQKYDGEQISFNACGVSRTSSATISVLLEWLRAAQRKKLQINRMILSDCMRELVEMAELDHVFPAHETAFSPASEE